MSILNSPNGPFNFRSMLLGWNPKRFTFLEALKEKYSVYLLNNTNALHHEWVLKDLKKNHKITDFDTRFFHKTFYSHLMRLRKPESKMFQSVVEATHIQPQETLLIDDSIENVLRAREEGWQAELHTSNSEIMDAFEGYITKYNR